jgi:hypothetical protein
MTKFRYSALIVAAALAGIVGGVALSQTVTVPKVTSVGPTDLFQDVVAGSPTAQSVYATAAQISGVQGYKNLTTAVNGTSDPAYTFTSGVVNAFAHGSGTIGTVTLTTEANPGDGQRECWWADQTTTSLVWTANTGQSIDSNKQTAGVTLISACIIYQASNKTWYSANN